MDADAVPDAVPRGVASRKEVKVYLEYAMYVCMYVFIAIKPIEPCGTCDAICSHLLKGVRKWGACCDRPCEKIRMKEEAAAHEGEECKCSLRWTSGE